MEGDGSITSDGFNWIGGGTQDTGTKGDIKQDGWKEGIKGSIKPGI